MSFHRNKYEYKVVYYCTTAGVHFEYIDFWDKDEEIFQNAQNLTALRKRFKQKIATVGGKGKAAHKIKRQEETHRLVKEEQNWLRAEEAEKEMTTKETVKKIEKEKKRKE